MSMMVFSLLDSMQQFLVFFSHNWSSWSSPLFSRTLFLNFQGIYDVLFEVSKFQHQPDLCTESSISLVYSLNWREICLLTYLLTPWCRVLLEKLTGLKLVKKFPKFYGTRKFITALKSLRQPSLSRASLIQSIYPHPTSWKSILILSTHLRLSIPSGLFPSGFEGKFASGKNLLVV